MASAVKASNAGSRPPSSTKDKEQQEKSISLMSTLQCDTPEYDTFVEEFIGTKTGADAAPTISIARRLCPTWPMAQKDGDVDTKTTIRVGVMDSSFNPPHYCHAAYMECLGVMELATAETLYGKHNAAADDTPPRLLGIDAYLLLLGSQNADKKLEGATLAQRMRMVDMLATTVAQDTTADTWHMWKNKEDFEATALHNMAIGMVNTPLFVDKCTAVRDVVRAEWSGSCSGEELEVLSYFAMGWDALIRFFDPRYYADYAGEIARFFATGGRIAFSRRTGFPSEDVDAFFARADIAAYLPFIYELRLPKRVRHISSTDVRVAVRDSTRSVRDIPPRILEYVNSFMLYRD
ncbi:hypothetical protein H4217_000088 [Coemansia sp. RSA 1939]|nr:hypothetical protein H4217_000088 [Coemansia sp. RSA 1939]KAJ2618251.1 hypothetical protein EV177_000101 [Coemansia sp. RSA 1804]KAJ2695559.1 hypothetical protein GGH99_000061 [Coemansia sp. RSA 1285]